MSTRPLESNEPMQVHPRTFPSPVMGSPDIASKAYYVEHLGESPTIIEGESVTEASVQQREAEQHIVLGRRLPDQYGTAYPNKRRLVITAMSSEPILIEIRQPDVQQSIPYLGAANCSQCDLGRICLQHGDQNSPSHKDLRKELSLIFRNREMVESNVSLWIEEQARMQESPSDSKTQTETWTDLCMKAVASMQFLEGELKTLKENGEQDALRMASISRGLQNELEREKEMREHDGRASDARILKLQTQLARQAEEIERQWNDHKDATYDQTQDLKHQTAIQTSGLLDKSDCNTLGDGDLLSSTQRLKDNEEAEDPITDKETECEILRLKIEELKEALGVASADSLISKIKEKENRDLVHKEEHQQALAKKDTEIETLRMKVEGYKLKIEEMELGDLDLEDRSSKDRVDNEKALADSEILRLKVKDLEEENLVTLASAESLRLKVEEMKSANVNLETQFSNYKEEHKQALANKEAQTENLRMEVEECKAKIDEMEERILMLDAQLLKDKEEQEKALVNKEAECELLKMEVEEFKLKMEEMNSGQLSLETEMMQEKLHHQKSLAEKEGECEMLKVKVEEFKLKIEEMNSGNLSLENQMTQEKLHHQNSLAEKEADCEMLRMKVEQFMLKIEEMDSDDLYLSQQREEHQKALADKEAECEVLRKKIEESNRDHAESHQLEIQEMEKEKAKEERLEEPISTSVERGNVGVINYVTTLEGERDHLLRELEKVTKNYNRAASKLKENVAKRRKLEAESEGENQQRSNLVAALYDLEGEVEVTVSTIKSLETSTVERLHALTADLQNFQEELEKAGDLRISQTECSEHNDSDNIASVNNVDEQSPSIHNPELTFSEVDNVKGIAEANSTVAKIASGIEKLLSEISTARVAIRKALRAFLQGARTANNEILVKLEILQNERENLRHELKNVEDDNKELEDENLSLARELSSLKAGKEKMSLQVQDLEKEIGTLQDDLAGLRDENRRLLKEAKWKSVGKQGGYQESLVIKEWEKKLEKLEDDYANLRKEKKALVEEKHRLEDEVDRARDKGFMSRDSCGDGEDDRKLENELSSVTQERNKLRKVRIALAVENVSLKETLTELRTKADVLEAECEALRVWKDKVGKLEEECEDLRDWKSKAEALEAECEELRGREKMKEEAREIHCEMQKWRTKAKKLEDECCNLVKSKESVEEECSNLRTRQVSLEAERDNLLNLKQKSENLETERAQLYDYKLKVETIEKGIQSDNRAEDVLGLEFEKLWNYDSVRELKQKVARLEEENLKLCQCHQAALDKQWDVLEADLKAFETKVEELETECATVRRNHLSSILENSQLAREKELFQKLFNEHKCTLEIMETAYECLQKEQARKDAEISKERNGYYTSIDNLTRKVEDLESTFSEKLRQQAASYAHYLAPKNQGQGQDTVFLTRQEYELLLAEKSVMLQERDGAHKKLCSIEAQNVHLNATIDCLRQEVARGRSHETKHADINAQVLLAQEIVNLQSMLTSLEEEVAKENSEKQRVFAMNASLRQELNRAHADALKVRKEKKKLLDFKVKESERCRSLIEQRQVTESSLTKQLTEINKERDSLQERLLMVFKERAQLASAAHERDDLILSLKEQITKAAKERENAVCLPKEEPALHVNGRNGLEFVKPGRTGNNVSFNQKVLDLEKSVHSLGAQLSSLSEQTKAGLLLFSNSLARGKDSLLEAVSAGNCGHILHANANVSLMKEEMPMSASKETMACHGVTLVENLHDFGATLRSLNDQLANLGGERDQLTLAKQSLMQERDHLLAAVTKLDTRKDSMSKRFEQDLHVEVSSVKSLLATAAREKEQMAISEGSLQQKLDDLSSTIQCLNTQLASLSSEKDHLVHANEAVTHERDTLLATVSILKKREDNSSHKEIETLLSHDVNKLVSDDSCPQPVLENTIQSGRRTDDEDKESTSYQEASKLTQENSLFLEQSERLKQERDNLAAELASLKKEKDCESGKKLRRKWNLKRPQDEIASLLKDNERLAASEASLKQQLVELEGKLSKENSTLGQEKLLLTEDRENIIEEVSLLKKEKDNFERKLEVESIHSMTELQQKLVDQQDQHNQRVENCRLLTEERDMLSAEVLQLKQQRNTTSEKMERELTGETATLAALGSNSPQMLVQVETNDHQARERERLTQPELAILEASIDSLKKQQVALVNEKTHIDQENEALKKERDELLLCISSLKKQHEAILAKAWREKESAAASEAYMKQKIDELVKSLQPLSKTHQVKHHTMNKGHRTQESNTRPECGTMHEGEKTFLSPPCDNHAHHQQQQPDVVKEDAIGVSVEQKLHGIALIMFTLRERLEATSKEKDRLNSNINPLKQECNKLRLAHSLSEQEKNILSKRITEMHATAERLAAEIARLQSALAESDKKLARATAEKESAFLRVAELQAQRAQEHLQTPYSMEKVQTLEAENRRLRILKDVFEERLKKCTMELEAAKRRATTDTLNEYDLSDGKVRSDLRNQWVTRFQHDILTSSLALIHSVKAKILSPSGHISARSLGLFCAQGKTSYLYQPTPLTKFPDDPVNLQPPLHNPTSYLSRPLSPCDILGRSRLPLPSIMQRPQWPNV